MAAFRLLPFFLGIVFMGSSPAVAQDASAGTGAVSLVRQPRGLHAKKLCYKYGICNGGGFQGGYQGHQENYGYQGQQPYPPINIAISQSQSSANEAGGGYSNGYYPSNYQYNGGYPQHGYHNHGYNQRPGGYFGNGQGAYNNQFNGNYYGPSLGQHGGGGYGFHGPAGYFDESQDNGDSTGPGGPGYNGRSTAGGNLAAAGSFAAAGGPN